MPLYDFACEKCNTKVEYFYKVSELPSELECEKCGQKLIRIYNCDFLLKGGDWPGKSIKLSHDKIVGIDKNEEFLDEQDIAKKEADEMLKQRRRGTQAWKEYQKHNIKKVERYKKNLRKGIRTKDDKKQN